MDSSEGWALTSCIAGLLSFYVLLLGLQLAGLPWSPATLLPALAAAGLGGWIFRRRGGRDSFPFVPLRGNVPFVPLRGNLRWDDPGWGDAVAAAAFLVFVACTTLLWNLNPDFIYHWGIKGEKFALAQGIDYEFLASRWNSHVHPDYPNLLPSLFAVTAILTGSFGEAPMALWSALFYLLSVLAGRELLQRADVSRFARQAGVALLALVLTMFGVGYLTAGGADWLMVLAFLAGGAILVSPPAAEHDARMGVVAALAAASKIEGMPLAAFLIAVHLLRRWPTLRAELTPRLPRCLMRLAAPVAVMAGIWTFQVTSYELFQPANTGSFSSSHAAVVLPELLRSLLTVNWHGLTFCLFALPLLLADRRLRWIAAVGCLQLALYVYVYMSASVDPREWVTTSAARLYFHLVPAVLLLTIAAADRWSRPSSGRSLPDDSSSGDSSAAEPVMRSFLA